MRHAAGRPFEPRARGADAAGGAVRRRRGELVRAQPADLRPRPPRLGRARRGVAAACHLSRRGSDDVTAASDAMGDRLRPLVPKGLVEKKMFGGLGFMLNGNMLVGTTAKGALLDRVDPDKTGEALERPGAYAMHMGPTGMTGFIAAYPKS